MSKKSTSRKTTRGIDKDFAEAFNKSELYKLYEKHKDELFIGVRNNYLNLYYNCDSIAKVEYKKTNEEIICEIDKYYLDGKHYTGKGKRCKVEPNQICEQYEKIKGNSNNKKSENLEKKAQSKLVILNNQNKKSNWFCIDVEYVKAFDNQLEKDESEFNGRFDIIALSKEKPHRTALIELKYGNNAIGGNSGIYKHIEDFSKFCQKGFFGEHLKHEIIDIIKSQIKLGIEVPFELPKLNSILSEPEFYFITLDNNPEKAGASTPKQTMGGYLFKDKRWKSKKFSQKLVETDFGDITKKNNKFHATFLFSTAKIDNIKISDIIDGDYDEKIKPE